MTMLLLDLPNKDHSILTVEQGKPTSLALLHTDGEVVPLSVQLETGVGMRLHKHNFCLHPMDFLHIAKSKCAKVTCTTLSYIIWEFECRYLNAKFTGEYKAYKDIIIQHLTEQSLYERTINSCNFRIKIEDNTVSVFKDEGVVLMRNSLTEVKSEMLNYGLLLFTTDLGVSSPRLIKTSEGMLQRINIEEGVDGGFILSAVYTSPSFNGAVELRRINRKDISNEYVYKIMSEYLNQHSREVKSIYDLMSIIIDNGLIRDELVSRFVRRKEAFRVIESYSGSGSMNGSIGIKNFYTIRQGCQYVNSFDSKGIYYSYELGSVFLTDNKELAEEYLKELSLVFNVSDFMVYGVKLDGSTKCQKY